MNRVHGFRAVDREPHSMAFGIELVRQEPADRQLVVHTRIVRELLAPSPIRRIFKAPAKMCNVDSTRINP